MVKISQEVEERIKIKLKKRLEEEAQEIDRQTNEEEKSKQQDELLKHRICPRCGGDAKRVFSFWTWLSFGDWKKMRCISCGFTKRVYSGWFGGGDYY